MIHLILGSQSPRRREILSSYGVVFEPAISYFVEEEVPFEGDPEKYVLTLSGGKAGALVHQYPGAAILTADSVVYSDGKIYNKPVDQEDAMRILMELSGRWHSVFTGVTLRQGDLKFEGVEETLVEFKCLKQNELEAYIHTNEWADKAGGYGIQTHQELFVKQIKGCFYNVMGLPVNTVRKLLLNIGITMAP